jgi:phospholipase/carboxylesterase
MRAWYDLRSLERVDDEDEAGLRSSAALIEGLIEREAERGIDPDKIVLAGFSQGGAIALFTALRYSRTLAGAVALSAYLPLGEVIGQELHPANAKLPIFMAHGAIDDVVPIRFSRNSRKKLHQMGYEVSWWEYPVSHTVIPEELQQVKLFLSDVL